MQFEGLLKKISEIFHEGKNVSQYIREQKGLDHNDIETILISYDFQAGSYIKAASDNKQLIKEYCHAVSEILNPLSPRILCDVGIGEATKVQPILDNLSNKPEKLYGLDLSWSRIRYARKHLLEVGADMGNFELFTGNMFSLPMQDKSVDVAYTSHSLEPNGGREEEAIRELMRISRKWLVLIEPAYEFADQTQRDRMIKMGYVKGLPEVIKRLGGKIVEHRLLGVSSNPLNPSGVIIAEVPDQVADNRSSDCIIACPISKKPMMRMRGSFFCEESLLAYPVLDDVPCLLPTNAIMATKFADFQ